MPVTDIVRHRCQRRDDRIAGENGSGAISVGRGPPSTDAEGERRWNSRQAGKKGGKMVFDRKDDDALSGKGVWGRGDTATPMMKNVNPTTRVSQQKKRSCGPTEMHREANRSRSGREVRIDGDRHREWGPGCVAHILKKGRGSAGTSGWSLPCASREAADRSWQGSTFHVGYGTRRQER